MKRHVTVWLKYCASRLFGWNAILNPEFCIRNIEFLIDIRYLKYSYSIVLTRPVGLNLNPIQLKSLEAYIILSEFQLHLVLWSGKKTLLDQWHQTWQNTETWGSLKVCYRTYSATILSSVIRQANAAWTLITDLAEHWNQGLIKGVWQNL